MFEKSEVQKPIPSFVDKESLEEALVNIGISGSGAEKLSVLARFSLHLSPNNYQDRTKRLFSKIGGLPDLPKGTNWPVRPSFPLPEESSPKGFFGKLIKRLLYHKPDERETEYRYTAQPYNFIAQISFEEMATAGAEVLQLPHTGALYLFYDDISQCWGFDPTDAIGFKVIYVSSIQETTTVERPKLFAEAPTYNEVCVEPVLRFEPSRSEGLHFEKLALSEHDIDTYMEFEELIEEHQDMGWPSSPAHKVRGWSNNVQNPMEEECALVTSGIDCGGPKGYSSPEAKRILEEPNEWVQLLQIDSDDNAGMMWGDAGMLYLWIKRTDLEKKNFDNTWLILQCG